MLDTDYDTLNPLFEQDPLLALDALILKLADGSDHHALFRARLLKKRVELKLPLINPGELKNAPADARKEYEDFVETVCREIGSKYLAEGNLTQAWRYFRTIGDTAL